MALPSRQVRCWRGSLWNEWNEWPNMYIGGYQPTAWMGSQEQPELLEWVFGGDMEDVDEKPACTKKEIGHPRSKADARLWFGTFATSWWKMG